MVGPVCVQPATTCRAEFKPMEDASAGGAGSSSSSSSSKGGVIMADDRTDITVLNIGGDVIIKIPGISLGLECRVAGVRERVRTKLSHGEPKAVAIKLLHGGTVLKDDQRLADLELPAEPTLQAIVVSPGYEHLEDLRSEDARVRQKAAWALASIGPGAAAYSRELMELLHDTDPLVRSQALKAFGTFGRAAEDCAQAVAELLNDAAQEVRLHAADAYVQMGLPEERAGALLGHPDARLRSFAAHTLGDALKSLPQIHEASKWRGSSRLAYIQKLAALLRDPNTEVCKCANRVLCCMGWMPNEVMAANLSDHRVGMRVWATQSLWRAGKDALPFAQELAGALGDADTEVREHAARAMGLFGTVCAPHVAAIAELLRDQDDSVRYWATWAIGKSGNAVAVLDALRMAVMSDPCSRVRCCAAKALASIEKPSVEEATASATALVALSEGPLDDRRCAAWALGKLGELALSHADALVKLLQDKDPAVRRSAAEALGSMGEPAAVHSGEVEKLLEDSNSDVRHWAAWSLRQLGKEASGK